MLRTSVKLRVFLTCLTLFVTLPVFSAEPPSNPAVAAKGKGKEIKRFDQPAEAEEFYRLKRAPVGQSTVPVELYLTAREQMEQMPQHSIRLESSFPSEAQGGAGAVSAQSVVFGSWQKLGPANIGGRTRALLIHPTNPSILYAGGVAGGVFKSTTGGSFWFVLNDLLPNLAIGSLAMDPLNPDVIYAGTGEGYFNGDAVRGAGILKTTDGGTTWTHLASTQTPDFHYVNDLVISKNGSHAVYAATRTGIWRSLDGGATWSRVLEPYFGEGCVDLAARTDTAADSLFAVCTVFKPGAFFNEMAIFRNTDAAGSGAWQQVYTEPEMGRTSLAIAPSNQNVVYALAASYNTTGNYFQGLHAVFRSVSGGAVGTWSARVRNSSPDKLNTLLLTNFVFAANTTCGFGPQDTYYNQGWYDNVIAVDPVDSNRVWVGGIDLFRSEDGGANWGLASYWFLPRNEAQYVHADHHAIVFHPQYNGTTNKTMFVANDGGVFRTNDARAAVAAGNAGLCGNTSSSVPWFHSSLGLSVTQFYHGTPYPDGLTYLGGTQDNGTIRGTDTGLPLWSTIAGGDGGYVAVDPTNPLVIYFSYQNWEIYKSIDGGQTSFPAKNGITGDYGLFITPFIMDPTNSSRLWTGGSYLWRTVDGAASWQRASSFLNGRVSALSVAKTNANRVLAGTSDGYIYRSTAALSANSGTAWAWSKPQDGYVSSVAIDPLNENIAYATYSNFGVTHVWKSLDGGVTWAPIDGSGTTGLPDIPVHSIVVDPVQTARLYIGTDLGVFVSLDRGATWFVENTGFANVVTESLSLNQGLLSTPTLFAFTHGRGAWRVPISACSYATFNDVPATHWAYRHVEALANRGITSGCGGGNYCPDSPLTRAQMSVFILAGAHGPSYVPPPATGQVFSDVPANAFAAAWIEQFKAEGYTAGCSAAPPGGLPAFCPDSPVTRAQMAVFLLLLRHGAAYAPPPATGTVFADVPANGFAAAWIEQLYREGITAGCGGGNYCPNSTVTRAQMAVFISGTLSLPLCQN